MREESHLDEMRDAIRGDFERLAERRGDQKLLRVTEDVAVVGTEPEPAPESESVEEPEAETEPERRSWLARVFSP